MSKRRAGGIAGTLAALAVGVGLVAERTIVAERRKAAPDADRLGTLHSQARTVIASDGVHLHAEVDEVAPYSRKRRGKHEAPAADLPQPKAAKWATKHSLVAKRQSAASWSEPAERHPLYRPRPATQCHQQSFGYGCVG